MDTLQRKLIYARELLKLDGDPQASFKAGLIAFDDHTGSALQVQHTWPRDPIVIAEQERLLEGKNAGDLLASKERQARDIYLMANDTQNAVEDRLKAHKLFAEIMGYIEKPQAGGGINVLNQGVMIVKDTGTDAEWEAKTIRQQRALTADVTVN